MADVKIEGIARGFEEILREFPARRRELHKRVGAAIERELGGEIDRSLSDSGGRVKRWQVAHIGTGGGYAAIRPARWNEGGDTRADSAGAITNYLEHGHRIRPPGGGKGYRPRIKMAFVSGRHFYAATSQRAESLAIAEAEAWADELAATLEGML